MCNLDRFIEATIPVGVNIAEHGLKDLFKAYHKASINGLKIELLDLEVQHVCTFVPTLSSLFFMTKSVNNKSKVYEVHEDQPPFKRKPMSIALKEALRPVDGLGYTLSETFHS
jgi:hypothetical protein